MKYINLLNRKKEIVEKAIVDDEDYEWLNKYSWCFSNGYAIRGYRLKGKSKTKRMHHDVMGKIPKGKEIDHINRNELDNRKENLRFVTSQENKLNRTTYGKVPYKGIYIKRKTKKGFYYQAQIGTNGKQNPLGCGYDAKKLYKEKFVPAYIKKYGVPPPK